MPEFTHDDSRTLVKLQERLDNEIRYSAERIARLEQELGAAEKEREQLRKEIDDLRMSRAQFIGLATGISVVASWLIKFIPFKF